MFNAFSSSGFDKIIDQINKPKKQTYMKSVNEAAKKVSAEKPKVEELNAEEIVADFVNEYNNKSDTINLEFSQSKLQEAIIWSEILGKPVSKRRKRREL